MRIRRGTTAEKTYPVDIRTANLMPFPGRDENGITGADGSLFPIDLHEAGSFENKVNLLTVPMVMPLRCSARGEAGFGEALVNDRGVSPVQNAPDS